MKYLKLFNEHTEYEAFTATTGFVLPNVSFCKDKVDEVHYNPYTDPCQKHDYVEIGGIKWATKNVGACNITDVGLYFQWGDAKGYTAAQVGSGEGQKKFGWQDYVYGNGKMSPGSTGMTKYNSTDGKTVLDLSDDAANVAWGSSWRMPTSDEFEALGAATTSAWTTNYQGSGINGMVLTDKTDSTKTLFFPATGDVDYTGVHHADSLGIYWSSSLDTSFMLCSYKMSFGDGAVTWKGSSYRNAGMAIRGILDN